MHAHSIIERFNVREDCSARFRLCREPVLIDDLVFEAAPEGFDVSVIVTVAFAAHGGDQFMLGQDLSERSTGELQSTVRVDDETLRRTSLCSRHLQCPDHPFRPMRLPRFAYRCRLSTTLSVSLCFLI